MDYAQYTEGVLLKILYNLYEKRRIPRWQGQRGMFLQVQNSVFNFLGTTLVPILGADVAAGTAGHIHLVLVLVAALGAGPDQLAVIFPNLDLTVIAAALAVVGLGVQLCLSLIHI